MAYIATYVVVQAVCLLVVYLVFLAVAHGLPKDQDHEIEVKLFPPSIRRKVKRR
jgi:hypothetical protein